MSSPMRYPTRVFTFRRMSVARLCAVASAGTAHAMGPCPHRHGEGN